MSKHPLIVYAAPGAGLGHLVRACAVATTLRGLGPAVRIVTHSRYTGMLRPVTGLNIDFIPSDKWVSEFPAYMDRFGPDLVVLDTFPFGIRGEALALAGRCPVVFMARRLKPGPYLNAAGLSWDPAGLLLKRVIAAEPLNSDFESLLREAGADIRYLPGRIRLDPPSSRPIEPEELARRLEIEAVRLVVHSGPEHEVRELIRKAGEDAADDEKASVLAILPRPFVGSDIRVFHYFPASVFYDRAVRVITGGGYNSLAETAPYPGKGLQAPFPRRYDDQDGRLSEPPPGPDNGAFEAARLIASWL